MSRYFSSSLILHKIIKSELPKFLSTTSTGQTAVPSFINPNNLENRKWHLATSELQNFLGEGVTSSLGHQVLKVRPQEFEKVSKQIEKLQGLQHPIMKIKSIEDFLSEDICHLSFPGQLILLMSNAIGVNKKEIQNQEEVKKVLAKHQRVAEIVDLINNALFIHRHVMDIEHFAENNDLMQKLDSLNKIAILAGDYFMATASDALSSLRIAKVVELVSIGISDNMKGEFLFSHDAKNQVLFSPDATVTRWKDYMYFTEGSLIANGVISNTVIAQYSDTGKLHDAVMKFTKNFVYAWKASSDLQAFETSYDGVFNLNALPILIHMETEGNKDLCQYAKQKKGSDLQTNHKKIHEIICSGSAVSKTKEIVNNCLEESLEAAKNFEDNQARRILYNIVNSLSYA